MDRRTFIAAASGLAASASCTTVPVYSPLQRPAERLIKVACPISHNTTEIDFIGPKAVFETWHPDSSGGRPNRRFEIFTVSHSREPMNGRIADFTFADVPAAEVIVVPAQVGSEALTQWLQRAAPSADVTMSVCIGALHLARAGLLDGLSATTHHESIDAYERQFPLVHWVRNVRFVENERISTSGGLTAGIDLALHVVERYFDRATAQAVADHLEYEGARWVDPTA